MLSGHLSVLQESYAYRILWNFLAVRMIAIVAPVHTTAEEEQQVLSIEKDPID
jgi:hypothetical protein